MTDHFELQGTHDDRPGYNALEIYRSDDDTFRLDAPSYDYGGGPNAQWTGSRRELLAQLYRMVEWVNAQPGAEPDPENALDQMADSLVTAGDLVLGVKVRNHAEACQILAWYGAKEKPMGAELNSFSINQIPVSREYVEQVRLFAQALQGCNLEILLRETPE